MADFFFEHPRLREPTGGALADHGRRIVVEDTEQERHRAWVAGEGQTLHRPVAYVIPRIVEIGHQELEDPIPLDVAIGEWAAFSGPTEDYTFASLTYAADNGLYGTFGTFSQDFDGDYLELGYGTTVAEIDLGIAVIFANDDLIGEEDESLVFTIGKSFDL